MRRLTGRKIAFFASTRIRFQEFPRNVSKSYATAADVSQELTAATEKDLKSRPETAEGGLQKGTKKIDNSPERKPESDRGPDTASVETALEDTNITIPDHKPTKPYDQILTEMIERSSVARDPPFKRAFEDGHGSFFKPITHNEMSQPPRRGDLVLIRSGPAVVIGMSRTSAEGKLTVANQVGEVREIGAGSIEARLGPLLDSKGLQKRQTIVPGEKHVVRELHDFLASELRGFAIRTSSLGGKLQSAVRDVLLLLQREETSQTLPFYDFAGMVLKFNSQHARLLTYPDDFVSENTSGPSKLTPELIYAVKMALSQYTLANKHVLQFHRSSNYILTVLPRAVEERNLRILSANALPEVVQKDGKVKIPKPLLEYTKDYAVGNLTRSRPDADGVALEIMRKHPGFVPRDLSSDTAAEFVNRYGMLNPEGPKLDRFSTQWFQTELPPMDLDLGNDIAGTKRQEFEPDVYCIDGETAHEIDDGISVQTKGNTLTVGVHIADPTSALGTDIVGQVYRRPTTVYLPTGARFMLPQNVFSAFSLQNGSRALSVLMDFHVDSTGELAGQPKPKNIRVQAHTLKSVKSITYNQVDALFKSKNAPSELLQLRKLATVLRKTRPNQLAFSGSSAPMVSVENGQPTFISSLSAETSPATEVVTEMMILANTVVARYMQAQRIPAMFRCQNLVFWSAAEMAQFDEAFKATGSVGVQFRRNLPRAFLSTRAAPHRALDVAAYTHFTSPLRRGQDIFAHLQLHAHIQGNEAPLSDWKLAAMIPWVEAAQKIAKDTERTARRYWTLVALESQRDDVFEGYVSHADEDAGISEIYIPKWGVSGVLPQMVPLGTAGQFRITDVHAVGDRLAVDFA